MTDCTRRSLLGGAATLSFAAALPAAALAQPRSPQFRTLLDRFADTTLGFSPQQQTLLGLDKGARAGARRHLDDARPQAIEARLSAAAAMQRQLRGVSKASLAPQDQTTYEAVDYALGLTLQGGKFAYGDNIGSALGAAAVPYVVSQQNGSYNQVPEFLDAYHKITTAADAEAYLSRLSEFAGVLDAETARIRADAGRGVVPPSFLIATIEKQLAELRATPVAQAKLVRSVADRAKKLGLKGDWEARAAKMVEASVYPALDRQLAAIRASGAKAGDNPSVSRLPDGEAYYRWALKAATTTDLDADAIHRTGLEQNRALQAEMDAILKAQGMTQGSVGERVAALNADPKQLWPNTDEGRAGILAYVRAKIEELRGIIPQISRLKLNVALEVKRVPPDIQAGAALGYTNFAALDGSRPAIYYINLADTANWPRYSLTSLSAHEGIPGHDFQGAYLAEHAKDVPLVMSLMGFNAFVEGWALYAEQLADEHGVYRNDPLGRLGMLQALAFRAARLVVDTGLHSKGWSRARAIDWMVENTGRTRGSVTSEVDRYCASPGQACGYKVGHNEIIRLRSAAQQRMGARFDVRAFNDAIVTTGGVPLAALPAAIDRYLARA
jgi:uncharacterized protein (DUF885 family)